MSSELTVDMPIKETVSIQREKTIKSLHKKFSNEKLTMIKTLLHNNGIAINPNAKTVDELMKYIKQHENPNIAYQAEQMISGISKNLSTLLSELENGSMNAFQKFIKSAEPIVKPIAKVGTKSLAIRSAVILAPTVTSKLVISAGITGWNAFKLIKNKKERTVLTREVECERILQELEVTIINDTIIDTRFNEETQDKIKDFLKKQKIDFIDSGYISLRQTIHNLDFANKKELCHILNDMLHKGINIEERIEKTNNNIFERVKKNTKKIAAGSATGIGVATAINSVDPALLAGPLNGTVLGYITHKLTSSNFLGKITGVIGTAGTGVLEYVPVVGEQFENIFATENLIALGIAGGGLGIAGIAASKVINITKSLKDKFKYSKRKKEINKLDAQMYSNSDIKEIEIIKKIRTEKENSPEEQLILDLIYGYIVEDLNQTVEKPNNIFELTILIGNLDDTCKRKLTIFFERLKDCNTNNYGDFINFLIKSGKTLSTLTLLGLSGLSIYDLMKDGTFLPEVSAKLFADVSDNVYLMNKMATLKEISDEIPKTSSNELKNIPISEFEKTQATYNELSEMVYETKTIDVVRDNILLDQTEFKNDVKQFLENPIENIKNGVTTTVGETINEFTGIVEDVNKSDSWKETGKKIWDRLVDAFSDRDFSVNLGTNGIEVTSGLPNEGAGIITDIVTGKTSVTFDKEKIFSTIKELSDNEKINLIHYFNSLSEENLSENGKITYKAISQALQDNEIGNYCGLKELIVKHNERVLLHQGISKILNIVTPSAALIENTQEEANKPSVKK